VTSRSARPRVVLGVPFTVQAVALVLAALALTAGVGFAVLTWLERTV
jgi:hypothetical protein